MLILATGLSAGVVAILATVAIERLGGRLGGLIASAPSTIVPASIGLWSTADTFDATMAAVPAGILLAVAYLWLWRVVPPRLPDGTLLARLLWMTALSTAAWVSGAFLVILANVRSLEVAALITVATLVVGAAACVRAPPAPKGTRRVSAGILAARGLFAACAIAASLLLATSGYPLAAGVMSVFPAIFFTSMVAVWFSQGEAVQAGAVGPMMLGASSVSTFALMAAVLFPVLGPVVGAAVCWCGAVICVSVPAWAVLTYGWEPSLVRRNKS